MCPADFTYNAKLKTCHLFTTGIDAPTQSHGEAYSYCQQYGENVHLVAVETEQEQQYLFDNFIHPNSECMLHTVKMFPMNKRFQQTRCHHIGTFHTILWICITDAHCADGIWTCGQPTGAVKDPNTWCWNMNTYMKTMTYTNWFIKTSSERQPNNIPDGVDMRLRITSKVGAWYDDPAARANRCFICEYDLQ